MVARRASGMSAAISSAPASESTSLRAPRSTSTGHASLRTSCSTPATISRQPAERRPGSLRDRSDELGLGDAEREADEPAERGAHEDGPFDTELVEQRRYRRRERMPVELVDRVGVAVPGEIRSENVVRRSERGAELFPHVCG